LTPDDPHGIAIDPRAGKIWWPNYASGGGSISSANLSGGGGADLATGDALLNGPDQPALLEAPSGGSSPNVKGTPAPGSELSCGHGGWDPDAVSSLLYRAPSAYSYQWLYNGKAVPGATKSTVAVHSVGNYRCEVAASNQAGSATQRSGFLAVFKVGKAKLSPRTGLAKLLVRVPDPGKLSVGGKGVAQHHGLGGPEDRAATRNVKKAGKVRISFKPKRKARRRLQRHGKAKVKLRVAFNPDGGRTVVQERKVKLKLR
jgi:hypothetical protein